MYCIAILDSHRAGERFLSTNFSLSIRDEKELLTVKNATILAIQIIFTRVCTLVDLVFTPVQVLGLSLYYH